MECHFLVWNRRIIIRETYIGKVKSLFPVKSFKVIITKTSGDFPCAVRTEVKEDHGISILNRGNRLSIL